MIIAITGASGFVGQLLAKYHINQGDEVRYLTRTNHRNIHGAIPFISHVNASYEVLLPFLQNVDVLYHCAAELNHDELMVETNVLGTKNLVNLAVGRVKRFVLLSSTGVYGAVSDTMVTEETQPTPNNPYEISKLEADKIARQIAITNGLSLVIIRPSNIYGNTMTNQSLFGLIKAVQRNLFFFMGPKGAIANYIHVDNVIHALVLAGSANHITNASIYNVSDHCTVEELIGYIAAALNKECPRIRLPLSLVRMLATVLQKSKKSPLTNSRVDALTSKTIYNADKIKLELGYQHEISIEQGIKDLTQYLLNGFSQTH